MASRSASAAISSKPATPTLPTPQAPTFSAFVEQLIREEHTREFERAGARAAGSIPPAPPATAAVPPTPVTPAHAPIHRKSSETTRKRLLLAQVKASSRPRRKAVNE